MPPFPMAGNLLVLLDPSFSLLIPPGVTAEYFLDKIRSTNGDRFMKVL